MKQDERGLTVGEFKRQLALFPDDWTITFSGNLDFYRLKMRGEKLVNVEFNQTVFQDSNEQWHVH